MEDKIILVGKHITEHSEEIEEGYVQVEFDVESLLDEIPSTDIKMYARDNYDYISKNDLDELDQDDLVEELRDRGYNFLLGADPQALVDTLEKQGYKCLDEYDDEYYEYLKTARLDIQDMNMLKEITKRYLDASIFEKAEMHKAIMNFPY